MSIYKNIYNRSFQWLFGLFTILPNFHMLVIQSYFELLIRNVRFYSEIKYRQLHDASIIFYIVIFKIHITFHSLLRAQHFVVTSKINVYLSMEGSQQMYDKIVIYFFSIILFQTVAENLRIERTFLPCKILYVKQILIILMITG